MPTGRWWHTGNFEDITYDTYFKYWDNNFYVNCADISSVTIKRTGANYSTKFTYYAADGSSIVETVSGSAAGTTFTIDKSYNVFLTSQTAYDTYILFHQ